MKNSKAFQAAIKAVENIGNIKADPLSGRTPSNAFMDAVEAVKRM